VEFSFIWNIHDIYRKKPDLILMANTIGSRLHFKVSKYAHENGIKIFALISEGNFRTDGSFDYFGYNADKTFYQEYICHWSKRTKEFFDKELPSLQHKNIITGATGFDRYKIYQFEERDEFLKRYNLPRYKAVIGYAGWAFGKIYNQQGRDELRTYFQDLDKGLKWMDQQMKEVESMLRAAIEKFPQVLFILKRHPNEANPTITTEHPNEMIALREYPNVLYITWTENLHDLINVCDLWTAFESTTALEAWLIDKETIYLNPDPDFNRDTTYLGTPISRNSAYFIYYIAQ
jgi:surface carbohydrate biosynthesis protein